MDFEPYSDVILIADVPESGLRAGDIGTVVERHITPSGATGYSVEFFDMTGATVAVRTLRSDQIRLPTSNDRPAARAMSA
ncbi:MAG: DUF4926 domain-containing protein [Tepidisphaeraceae bacterium]